MIRSFALAPLGCVVVFLAGCGQSPAPTSAPGCFFDGAKYMSSIPKASSLPPATQAVIKEGLTCNVGATCCSTLHAAADAMIASKGKFPQSPADFVGKCGRKDQVALFDCVKAEYNKLQPTMPPEAHMPPFPVAGEPVADTSADGVGTCNTKQFGEISGVSTGCCAAVQYAMQSAMKPQQPHQLPDVLKLIGKCGNKDQDSLFAFAQKMQKMGPPPKLQNLVEQITTAKVVAIDMMMKMIHGTSGQGATNSYQFGTIALFGSIGGIVGALSTLAIAKRCSSERMVIKSPLLA